MVNGSLKPGTIGALELTGGSRIMGAEIGVGNEWPEVEGFEESDRGRFNE